MVVSVFIGGFAVMLFSGGYYEFIGLLEGFIFRMIFVVGFLFYGYTLIKGMVMILVFCSISGLISGFIGVAVKRRISIKNNKCNSREI